MNQINEEDTNQKNTRMDTKHSSMLPIPFGEKEALAEKVQILSPLALAFPKENVSQATVAIYAKGLSDIDPLELSSAIEEIILTSRFFPTISEIRRMVMESRLNLPTAEEALGEMGVFIRSGGGRFSHHLIQEAYHSSGVESVFYDDVPGGVWRAQFKKAFEALRDAEIKRAMLGHD